MNQTKTSVLEAAYFFKKFMQSPKSIGSIVPSSSFLARAMLDPIPWDSLNAIVELGAGTGVLTRRVNDRKPHGCQALILEKDDDMRARLQARYPNLTVRSDAERIAEYLHELGLPAVDCILSGLPFTNFSTGQRKRILEEVMRSLRPGGLFVAFQYSLQMKNEFKQMFDSVDIQLVPFNLPPAFVSVCRKSK
ncbi:class I SAM-dependent methyltransferase [Effusibacillus lacus]|uniref:Phospholipid methyltransferase n=1 Tax=Effusibacillus lacus TaxID=1348429 RepID=A0A292YJR4_9BACL|nr:methyltransferase domain-containing protein [Effusibacillus lacus]TCS75540.1 phospholipid N-methyltransferase [Effusibacillus lacus]GAX89003.1 phospholipid methyltransferase [Effusibacillus lacus]